MDTIIGRIVNKEYKTGEVLWRGSRLNFIGVIQSGDINLERQINGTIIRSVRLSTGDVIQPRDFGGSHSSMLVRAVTDVKLWILHKDQIDFLREKNINRSKVSTHHRRIQQLVQNTAWAVVISLVAITIGWKDASRILSGMLYFESGKAGLYDNDHDRVLQFLNYAETVDHGATFAHNQEGFLHYQNSHLADAEIAFNRAISIDQTNGPGLNNLAVTHYFMGQSKQATTNQLKAAQSVPDNAIVHYNLGLLLTEQGDYLQAIREFKEASYINPAWALPYLQMGFNYIKIQDFSNAEKSANMTVELKSEEESAYILLGIALYNQDRIWEANNAFEKALQIEPSDRTALFYKALVLNKLEEFDSALVILEQLLMSAKEPETVARISTEIEATHRFLQSHQSADEVKGEE